MSKLLRTVFLYALLGAPAAMATTMVYLPAEELAARSAAIVVAEVGNDDSFETADGRVYTDTFLHIEEVIAGDAPATVVVRQRGGELASGAKVEIAGTAELEAGQKVVAFLRKVQDQWYLTALSMGVWYVEGEGPTATVRRDLGGVTMLQHSRSGTVPADMSPLEFVLLEQMRRELTTVTMGGVE